ncbi:MAG: hypothetical protein AB7P03_21875 [Kofleriaceae bacterium]
MSERRAPALTATLLAIAAVSLRRLLRGKGLWVGAIIAAIPPVLSSWMHRVTAHDLFVFEILIVGVLSAMFVSSGIGEELEDRTATYVWSRPVARWSLPLGKLFALGPIAFALSAASWYAMHSNVLGGAPPLASFGALAAETVAISAVGAAIALLIPKHAMALTIAYMVFIDVPLGLIDAKLRNLSISYQTRALAELEWSASSQASGAIGLAAIAAVWSLVVVLRLRRLEA